MTFSFRSLPSPLHFRRDLPPPHPSDPFFSGYKIIDGYACASPHPPPLRPFALVFFFTDLVSCRRRSQCPGGLVYSDVVIRVPSLRPSCLSKCSRYDYYVKYECTTYAFSFAAFSLVVSQTLHCLFVLKNCTSPRLVFLKFEVLVQVSHGCMRMSEVPQVVEEGGVGSNLTPYLFSQG